MITIRSKVWEGDLRVEEVVEDHVVQRDHQGAGVGHAGQAAAGGTQLVGDIGL